MTADDAQDLKDTIIPKSDQLNSDDLLTCALTVQVTAVRRGDRDQPVAIHIDGGRQPYKPCKNMRRVLIAAWGDDGRTWVGRSMTLYRDPEVVFGGVKVGGIRISHLSHIDAEIVLPLMITRGKRKPYTVRPLRVEPTARTPTTRQPAATDPRVKQLMEESLRGSLKAALATYATDFKPTSENSVLNFLRSLAPAALQPICDAVLPPPPSEREPGSDDDSEF